MNQRITTALARSVLAASLAGATLTACAPLIIGGAALGTMVAVDRRTSGAQLEDEGIELRVAARVREAFGDKAHVNVTSYNRQVLLTGEVPTDAGRQQTEQIVGRVDNVRAVVNELVVGGTSTITQRSSDTLITGKVKASLVDAQDLYVGAFKVVTERSVVYLMGRVTQHEAERATQIARTVGGVQRVVRIFEIITDDELRQLQKSGGRSTPAAAPTPAPVSSRP